MGWGWGWGGVWVCVDDLEMGESVKKKVGKRKKERVGEEEEEEEEGEEEEEIYLRYDSEKNKVRSSSEIGQFIKFERKGNGEEEELIGDCDE